MCDPYCARPRLYTYYGHTYCGYTYYGYTYQVCDPYCGTASTLVAAAHFGGRVMGGDLFAPVSS